MLGWGLGEASVKHHVWWTSAPPVCNSKLGVLKSFYPTTSFLPAEPNLHISDTFRGSRGWNCVSQSEHLQNSSCQDLEQRSGCNSDRMKALSVKYNPFFWINNWQMFWVCCFWIKLNGVNLNILSEHEVSSLITQVTQKERNWLETNYTVARTTPLLPSKLR